MSGFPMGFGRNLSDRGRAFGGITATEGAARPEPLPAVPDDEPTWAGARAAWQAATEFDEAYRGIVVHSLGGPLEGLVRFGVSGARPLWQAGGELAVFRCGSHPTIQCAVVASVDGRLGCSWSGEFTPLFDSVERFAENAAAWGTVQGWEYAAVGDIPVEVVLGVLGEVTPDGPASGELTTWWIAPDHVVVAQQYLNPARSARPQISVLARTPAVRDGLRQRLSEAGVSPMALSAAATMGRVPAIEPPSADLASRSKA